MRTLVAGVLLLVGALLVPVATAGWWARDAIVPTQGYVETVTPLATDPAVVSAVEDRLVARTMQQVDRSAGLSTALRPRVRQLVRIAVQQVVGAPGFVDAWKRSNRVAHEELVDVLSGDSSAVRVRKDSTVDIRLGTLSTAVRQELVDAGVPFAAALPRIEASFPIGNTADLSRARQGYTLLDRWGRVLPPTALLLIALGLVPARRRGRALAWTAVVALLGLGFLAVGLVVGRAYYLSVVPSDLSRPAASAVFDTVTAGLRHDLLVVAVAAMLALVAGVVLARLSSHR